MGILGASGPTLSCRNTTLWNELRKDVFTLTISLDFAQPPNATWQNTAAGPSQISFNHISPLYANRMLWSQPKQTGDIFDDGMYEFLLFDLQTCGVDMLYNTSSNWLAVVDTSGPCLMLPPFLFDRLMTRLPVTCGFESGDASHGRLCAPERESSQKLPSLSFALDDRSIP